MRFPVEGEKSWLQSSWATGLGRVSHMQNNPLADNSSVRPIKIDAGSRSLSGRIATPAQGEPRGLIVALHGGSYTSQYFDSPGHSIMGAIARLGYAIIAVDRPGYGDAREWPLNFDAQVEVLAPAIEKLWQDHKGSSAGVFLYGHSIGGMIALLLGGAKRDFPLVGLSMTGAGSVVREQALLAFTGASQAPTSHVDLPYEGKMALMFGPKWAFDAKIAAADPNRDVPLATVELRDALNWQQRLPSAAKVVDVPVQFIVGEYDGIWHADKLDDAKGFFLKAPFADVYQQRQSGHDVELEHLGFAQALKVVAFAEECRLRLSKPVT
jgi:pimeloyl-ACP methyl ester carboxylesterase